MLTWLKSLDCKVVGRRFYIRYCIIQKIRSLKNTTRLSMEFEKKIAILQSNYIPWKGYFDLISFVDEFVIYDEVQYTKNDWRNRNQIKTPNGLQWLTIPVGSNLSRKICEVSLPENNWRVKHWKTIEMNYKKAQYFKDVAEWLEPLYVDNQDTWLSDFNACLIRHICEYIGIQTKIRDSRSIDTETGQTKRLVEICKELAGTQYVSGQAARSYLDVGLFEQESIDISWFSYDNFPQYEQLWGEFEHNLSIIDVLFNCGPDSKLQLRHT